MREFICGYQTLLTCGGELLGLGLFLLLLLGFACLQLDSWLTTRKRRKLTPHPDCCQSPDRCYRAERCWMVPSCNRNAP